MDIKRVRISLNHKVKFLDGRYDTVFEFRSCIFKLGPQGYYYTAEIYDEKTNSTLICKLEEIEVIKNGTA